MALIPQEEPRLTLYNCRSHTYLQVIRIIIMIITSYSELSLIYHFDEGADGAETSDNSVKFDITPQIALASEVLKNIIIINIRIILYSTQ